MTTAITLVVLVGVLVVGVVVGMRSLFAPVTGEKEAASGTTPSCDATKVKKGQRLSTRQVQVSVYNAGSRSGLADTTMGDLVERGFTKGRVGNAPADSGVKRVQVWTTDENDPAARLVARQFGRDTKVRFVDDDLGPGVDVLVGDNLRSLSKAVRSVVVTSSSSACRPSSDAD